jgi:hypothetical protein
MVCYTALRATGVAVEPTVLLLRCCQSSTVKLKAAGHHGY